MKNQFKILFALMLFCSTVFGQTQKVELEQLFKFEQNPTTVKPVYGNYSVIKDGAFGIWPKDSSFWWFDGVAKSWKLFASKNNGYIPGTIGPQGLPGKDGKDGVNGMTPVVDMNGDQLEINGVTVGPHLTGPPGSGSGNGIFVSFPVFVQSPEYYKPAHANKTFSQAGYTQRYLDTAFAGVFASNGITLSDNVDYACAQAAYYSTPSGGKMVGYGTYYVNRRIYLSPLKEVYIEQGIYRTTNGNAFAIFGRDYPADGNTAMQWTDFGVHFNHVNFYGSDAQTGIDIPCGYNSTYDNCRFFDLGDAIKVTFQINAVIKNCLFTQCIRGITLDYVPGLNPATYQSNQCAVDHCQFSGRGRNGSISGSDYAIKTNQVSGTLISYCIIEGKSFKQGILITNNSSGVVKDVTIIGTHFECELGADIAFIKADIKEGNINIIGGWGQYPSLYADINCTGGTLLVSIAQVPWWMPRADGKMFKSTGTVQWTFKECNATMLYDRTGRPGKPNAGQDLIMPLFVDGNVQWCGPAYTTPLCGGSKYYFIPAPGSNY